MIAIKKSFLLALLLSAGVALGACTSETSSSSGPAPAPAPVDATPISASNAAGLWKLHYEWNGAAPPAWQTFFGSAATGDLEVAVPSETQKRGMFAAETTWGFAPMSSIAEGGKITRSFSLTGSDGKTFTLDFAGTGTGSSLEGNAKQSDDGAATARWSASKVAGSLVAEKGLAGDWTLDFQWSRRTPGQLLVTCDDSGTCTIPGGQDGGPKQDDVGVAKVNGNQIELSFSNAKHVGVVTSKGVVWGYMDSTDGNTGVWTAKRGKPAPAAETDGCTADVDCGSCERCERTTGRCIARLTC